MHVTTVLTQAKTAIHCLDGLAADQRIPLPRTAEEIREREIAHALENLADQIFDAVCARRGISQDVEEVFGTVILDRLLASVRACNGHGDGKEELCTGRQLLEEACKETARIQIRMEATT